MQYNQIKNELELQKDNQGDENQNRGNEIVK